MKNVLAQKAISWIVLSSLSINVSAQAQLLSSPTSSEASEISENSAFWNAQVLIVGRTYFISADNLNLRNSDSTEPSNIVGKLALNDEVVLLATPKADSPLVRIELKKAKNFTPEQLAALLDTELYVSKDYLAAQQKVNTPSKYFVIQNIATEKTRVYERCVTSPDCPHKMIFETDMVVGRPEVGTDENPHAFKTRLGHARISEWVKFYQDVKGHYPPWYTAGQDIATIPQPLIRGVSDLTASRAWTVKDAEGKDTIYGAFGWYAGKLEPADSMDYQWMHGTIGWGKDQDRSIQLTRGFLLNLFANPGSAGCTRLENQAIAYLRHLLPKGTDIYRIYAKEATREIIVPNRPLSRYKDTFNKDGLWSWILLTDGANKSGGLTADAATIYAQKIPFAPGENMIERGFFYVDQYPNPVALNYSSSAASGKSGDRYAISEWNFKGHYLVDEGRLVDYAHPSTEATQGKIVIGGFTNFRTTVPDFLKAEGKFYPAK